MKSSVLRAAHPFVAPADIERVGQAIWIIRANIKHNRQRRGRMKAAATNVKRQFPNRDTHAARALITQAQNPFAIGHHDGFDLVEAGMSENLLDAVLVRQAQEQSPRLSEQPAELLASGTDRRSIDDWQQFLEVLHHQCEE